MISSLADYLAEVDKRNITLKSTTSHWFRGQGRAAWGLVVCRGFGDPVEGGSASGDFVDDFVGCSGPDEGFGVVVPV